MPVAWELVVTWHGEPLRAELLSGKVRVSAAGPSADDLPLPLPAKRPLLRGDAAALALLPVGGAVWSIDGSVASSAAHLSPKAGIARLSIGNLEVAVQGTRAPPPFPRMAPVPGALVSLTAHVVATVLVGFVLTTEPPDAHRGFPHLSDLLTPPQAAAPVERPRRMPVATTPRWLAEDRPASVASPPRRATLRRRSRTAARPSPVLVAAPVELPALASPAPWPPELDVDGDDPIGDLASARSTRRGRGAAAGGLGSCGGAHFALLARRYGRDTAILACSPGVQFERPAARGRRQDVVLRERGGTTLAPEVWTWSVEGRSHR